MNWSGRVEPTEGGRFRAVLVSEEPPPGMVDKVAVVREGDTADLATAACRAACDELWAATMQQAALTYITGG
jgi:hypothetical protein